MSVTINNVIQLIDSYTGEDTTQRISTQERYDALTEAAVMMKQKMKGDMSNMTYAVDYIPGVYYYKISPTTFNVLATGDLRVDEFDHSGAKLHVPFHRIGSDKINEDIDKGRHDGTYALDRYDKELYLVINHTSVNTRTQVSDCGSTTGVTLDDDATSLVLDSNETIDGNALKFTIDVSNSGNDYATINIPVELDVTNLKDIANIVASVYLEDPSEVSSIQIKLMEDASNYYSYTSTSPFNETSFVIGWNKIVGQWIDFTTTGTPDDTAIASCEITINYSSSQTDMIARVDEIFLATPAKLKFHYLGYSVGNDTTGDEITEFSATSDVPYYSGQYDNAKFAHARFAATILLENLRLHDQADRQLALGNNLINEIMNLIPSSHRVESKSFRPLGVNHNRRRRL